MPFTAALMSAVVCADGLIQHEAHLPVYTSLRAVSFVFAGVLTPDSAETRSAR